MAVEYMQRIVTGDFAYAEVKADTFEEFVEASANLTDLVGEGKAVETVKKAFGKTTEVKSGGGFGKSSSGFGNKGRQESLPEKVELGEYDGYKVTLYTQGKFGPYVNAYKKGGDPERLNVNLSKGADPSEVDLDAAVEILKAA